MIFAPTPRDLETLSGLDPATREGALTHAQACLGVGVLLMFTQGYRSFAQQAACWARGRITPGEPCWHNRVRYAVGHCPTGEHALGATVTDARAGWSWHNWRCAYDVAIVSFPGDTTKKDVYDGPWAEVGARGEFAGLDWGGRWKRADLPHFERTRGRRLVELVQRYPNGLEAAA